MQRRTLLCTLVTATLLLAASPRLGAGLIISDGLVGYWKADGNTLDETPNANHGTVTGTEVYAPGRFGQAFDIGNAATKINYVQTSDSPVLDGFSKATWSFWFMPSTSSGPGGWLDKRIAHDNESSYSMGINYGGAIVGDNQLGITVGNATGTGEGGGASIGRYALRNGQWNHVAITFDKDAAENFAIYVNGTRRTLSASVDRDAPLYNSSAGLTIGRTNNGTGDSVAGLMDEIAVYDRALSSEEVKTLYGDDNFEVEVGSKLQGGFGNPVTDANSLIEAFHFTAAARRLEITASGMIDIADGTLVGPDGIDAPAGAGAYRPLEEQIIDAGGSVSSPHPHTGALIGAFVPAALADHPSFVPFDEDGVAVGIPSDALFLIGSGPYYFDSPGPGKLFLGVNDSYGSNNSGAFSVTLQPVPIPEPDSAAVLLGLAGIASLAVSIRRQARLHGPKPTRLP